jgi:hypothetical protein
VLYEERMSLIRAHVGVSAVWGVAAILQLLPFVRNYAGFAVHRFVGYVFYLCSAVFLVQMTYILFVLGMVRTPFTPDALVCFTQHRVEPR